MRRAVFPPGLALAFFCALAALAAAPARAADEAPLRRLTVATAAPHNARLEFVYRVPAGWRPGGRGRVLVLFGGRNWSGEKAVRDYGFAALADGGGAVLLAPSFRDDDYWDPRAWSGAALLEALSRLAAELGFAAPGEGGAEVYAFGYSAGAQCVALFAAWRPGLFRGVAMHACGVFPPRGGGAPGLASLPWLVTCGEHDAGRFALSYTFVQQLREAGGNAIFRNYPGGHELPAAALRLAAGFFADLWAGRDAPAWAGDDFRPGLRPAPAGMAGDPETRNLFGSRATAELWLAGE